MLPGKRQLVRAQSKMSPKCHSNFRSVHRMADAPSQWHTGCLEQQHLARTCRPRCHCRVLVVGAEGKSCRRAGRRGVIPPGETPPAQRSSCVHLSPRLSQLGWRAAGVHSAADADCFCHPGSSSPACSGLLTPFTQG